MSTGIYAQKCNEKKDSPGVGLTLSGGGARGFAHIGVLHILDSLDVRVDYISGTSIGALIGALYASGYSASDIEKFILETDWDLLFSSRVDVSYIHPRHRERVGREIISIPIEKRRFVIPTGAIEGQQLWNAMGEVFFPVNFANDFSKLNKPFACIATNIETGSAVVLNDGNLIKAIRASMAIPSVFTPVNINGEMLVDGGSVNNFPTDVVVDMGADFVIGVNVARGLRPEQELRTPIDILYQMAFFQDANTFQTNRYLANLYIEPALRDVSVLDFSDAAEIIEQGREAARLFIPDLIEIAEFSKREKELELKPTDDFRYVLDTIIFDGLNNVKPWFVNNKIGLLKGDTLTADNVIKNINYLYATGYFNRITYSMVESGDNQGVALVLNFVENPHSRLSVAFNYMSFTGLGLIGDFENNKFFFYNTTAYAKVLLGERPALKAGIDYFFDEPHNWWINLETQARYNDYPITGNFRQTAKYEQTYWNTELSFNRVTGQNSYVSSGIAYQRQRYSPQMFLVDYLRGRVNALNLFGKWQYNSLDRYSFSNMGQLINLSAEFFFNHNTRVTFYNTDDEIIENFDDEIDFSHFLRVNALWGNNRVINPRLTSYSNIQGAYNFFYNQGFVNMFNIGGSVSYLNNQVAFMGLDEFGALSKSIFAAGTGLRYNVWSDFYLSGYVNSAVYKFDFLHLDKLTYDNIILGAGINIGYDSAAGPLKITISYSPQTRRLLTHLNLGWSF